MSELGPAPIDQPCEIPTLDLRDAIRREYGLRTLAEEQRRRQMQEQAKAYGFTAEEAEQFASEMSFSDLWNAVSASDARMGRRSSSE